MMHRETLKEVFLPLEDFNQEAVGDTCIGNRRWSTLCLRWTRPMRCGTVETDLMHRDHFKRPAAKRNLL